MRLLKSGENSTVWKANSSPAIAPAYVCLLLFFFLNLYLFWPGGLSADSMTQYAQAKAGLYSDHHPAVMSFVWRYLDKIIEGPASMLVLHLCFFYGALLWGIKSFKNSKIHYIFLFLPLIPGILIYSGKIWKDVGYAYSFSFAAMVLCHAYLKQRAFNCKEQLFF